MEGKGVDRDLRDLTRDQLIRVAAGLKIPGRHRMKKQELIETVLLAHVYRSLNQAPYLLDRLTRQDLLRLCRLVGIRTRRRDRRAYLVERIRARRIADARGDQVFGKRLRSGTRRERARRGGRRPSGDHLRSPDEDLPRSYGQTRVVLLPVDPYLLHVYWEVTDEEWSLLVGRTNELGGTDRAVLRFLDLAGMKEEGPGQDGGFDVEIELGARNWYVHVQRPGRAYLANLGLRAEGGRFIGVARSNPVHMPPAEPCSEAAGPRSLWMEEDRHGNTGGAEGESTGQDGAGRIGSKQVGPKGGIHGWTRAGGGGDPLPPGDRYHPPRSVVASEDPESALGGTQCENVHEGKEEDGPGRSFPTGAREGDRGRPFDGSRFVLDRLERIYASRGRWPSPVQTWQVGEGTDLSLLCESIFAPGLSSGGRQGGGGPVGAGPGKE